MKKGDFVKIKKESCNSEFEKNAVFVVVDLLDNGRAYISPRDWRVGLVPQELISADMLYIVEE